MEEILGFSEESLDQQLQDILDRSLFLGDYLEDHPS